MNLILRVIVRVIGNVSILAITLTVPKWAHLSQNGPLDCPKMSPSVPKWALDCPKMGPAVPKWALTRA